MGKAPGRAGEARRERDDGAARMLGRLVFQRGPDDRLHAANVDEVESQGPGTGRGDAGRAVALRQPHQLLSLAEPGPGKGPAEQDGHELADGGADLSRVWGLLGRIVGVVSRPPARRLGRVDLDQPAVEIDPDEPESPRTSTSAPM
jgi:hypothetical protein